MRVTGGALGGRRLSAPPGRGTRPTSDRVREALFSSLGAHVPGAHVLDLYAGSGALGLEALSRGAVTATFVERDRRAAAVIARNLADLQLEPGPVGVVLTSARAFCAAPRGGPFSLVLVDPPYDVALEELLDLLGSLHAAQALPPGARVVLERARRDPGLDGEGLPVAALPAFLAFDRARSYGDTVVVHLIVVDLEVHEVLAGAAAQQRSTNQRSGAGQAMSVTAVCPGSFDPVTYGHLDVIERAASRFDRLVIGCLHNERKSPTFPIDERVALLEQVTGHLPNTSVAAFSGLLVDFCRANGVRVIVKGLRAVSDFEYELQMAQMNSRLGDVETFFLTTSPVYSFLSSSLVKEVARYGGDVSDFVPDVVAQQLRARLVAP